MLKTLSIAATGLAYTAAHPRPVGQTRIAKPACASVVD